MLELFVVFPHQQSSGLYSHICVAEVYEIRGTVSLNKGLVPSCNSSSKWRDFFHYGLESS